MTSGRWKCVTLVVAQFRNGAANRFVIGHGGCHTRTGQFAARCRRSRRSRGDRSSEQRPTTNQCQTSTDDDQCSDRAQSLPRFTHLPNQIGRQSQPPPIQRTHQAPLLHPSEPDSSDARQLVADGARTWTGGTCLPQARLRLGRKHSGQGRGSVPCSPLLMSPSAVFGGEHNAP